MVADQKARRFRGRQNGGFRFESPSSCRTRSFRRNCWIISSTIYRTKETHSKIVVSSPNRGSRALESTSSPVSDFPPWKICDHGRRLFQTPPHPRRVTPDIYLSAAPTSSRLQIQKRVIGSRLFPISWGWRWEWKRGTLAHR